MISSISTFLPKGRPSAESRRPRASRGHTPKALTAIMVGTALLAAPILGGDRAEAAEMAQIREFVLAKNVVDREPVDITSTFSTSDQQVYAFVRVDNPGMPTNVSFVWHRDDQVHATIRNSVGTSSGWRTWSSARLSPGQWRVMVVMEDGRVAGEKSFSIGRMNAPAISQMPKDDMAKDPMSKGSMSKQDGMKKPMSKISEPTGDNDENY